MLGLACSAYWVFLGVGSMLENSGPNAWIGIGVILSLLSWYALAKANEKAEEKDQQIKELLRLAAESAASGPTIVAQNDTMHALLVSLHQSVQRKAVFESAVSMAVPTPSMSGTGNVTITPGTGTLKIEGFAPTVSVEALDQEIREKEADVLRHLRLKEFKTGDVVRIHVPGQHFGKTGKVVGFDWPALYTIELADGQRVPFPFGDLR